MSHSPARAARFVLDPAFEVGRVDPRLFGSFVEHLGRCVYTGIYEPGHPAADRDGLRTDVLELIRELGVTAIRYPGGNFVSGYRWEDGVGPLEQRPRRLDPAWRSIETNAFGLGEFINALRKIPGSEPMLAVNLGTRGVQEALDLLEYANHPGETTLSDQRAAAGDKQPYGVRLWCLGNEMDGPWQIGHKNAEEYGRLAAATAWAMRLIDPDIELVACGSSTRAMDTFGTWEATVLAHTYDLVDYISMHAYYEEKDGDRDSFLASAADMEAFIDGVVATCDHAAAVRKSGKRMRISFDEWNVWYSTRPGAGPETREWAEAPRLLEDVYTVTDAVVVGSMLIALLRHADRVAIACLAQLVNVIAPIMTEPGGPAWRQTTFFPFAETAKYARDARVLAVNVHAPTHETAKHGSVPLVHATAVTAADSEHAPVTIFAVNRSQSEALPLQVDLRGLDHLTRVIEHVGIHDENPDAANTLAEPERVALRPIEGSAVTVTGAGRALTATLPPLSWSLIRLG
ncbi:alpha-N-arabinofuranosidase [Actinospica durhamensis]|uniref:non-reducing end alpha-L-arabinofuranosidase n=1 Tax=Actinospica durhamensis TaxID=1508375 RepID=A0A941EHT5_9ACTN|nr:alpha-N-arabinofuranosidase [Actinospica durhamensis]MBR7831737.1 alpha-N-arabinofuranosidase [Actinospica durhamensis]